MSGLIVPSTEIAQVSREMIRAFEDELLKLPQLEMDLFHEFPDKLYARTIFIPKGVAMTTKVHRFECYNVISQGDVSVRSLEGVYRYVAPFMMVTKPNTKRALYAHEDTVWTTVHPNEDNCRDIVELERRLTFCDREDLALYDLSGEPS
jgi:hypothetical protein